MSMLPILPHRSVRGSVRLVRSFLLDARVVLGTAAFLTPLALLLAHNRVAARWSLR
jgi:hypothetical protein